MLDLLSDAYQSGLADKGGVRLPQEVVGPPVPVISIDFWQHAGTLASTYLCCVSTASFLIDHDISLRHLIMPLSSAHALVLIGCCWRRGLQ